MKVVTGDACIRDGIYAGYLQARPNDMDVTLMSLRAVPPGGKGGIRGTEYTRGTTCPVPGRGPGKARSAASRAAATGQGAA